VPVARDLAELNAKLLADCHHDESRIMAGRQESVGALLLTEKEHLLPLSAEDFELAEVSFPKVDHAGCAKVLTNFYSVPLQAGSVVESRASSSQIEFRLNGVPVAQHQRSYKRAQQILDLEHYLEVLERKPGVSSPSVRTGSIKPSFARPAKAMRRAASKAKWATSAATTGFPCRWHVILPS
jgi:hypothetical protein